MSLTTSQAAEILEITPRAVCYYIAKGRLKATRYGMRRWRVAERDVKAFKTPSKAKVQ